MSKAPDADASGAATDATAPAHPGAGGSGADGAAIKAWIGDCTVGLVLGLIGIGWAASAVQLGLGQAAEMGPGAFPFVVAVLLAVGGFSCALRAWRMGHPSSRAKHRDRGAAPTVLLEVEAQKAFVLVVGFAFAFLTFGMPIASVAFLCLMLTCVGGRAPTRAMVASVLITIVVALVFDRLLAVQLPGDLLGLTR